MRVINGNDKRETFSACIHPVLAQIVGTGRYFPGNNLINRRWRSREATPFIFMLFSAFGGQRWNSNKLDALAYDVPEFGDRAHDVTVVPLKNPEFR